MRRNNSKCIFGVGIGCSLVRPYRCQFCITHCRHDRYQSSDNKRKNNAGPACATAGPMTVNIPPPIKAPTPILHKSTNPSPLFNLPEWTPIEEFFKSTPSILFILARSFRSPTTPTTPTCWRGQPLARRAAHPVQCPGPARAAAGGVAHDAMGFVAHIPHYLAQLDYPQASLSLLEHVERAGDGGRRPHRAPRGRARPVRRRSRPTSPPTPRSPRSSRRSSSSTTRSPAPSRRATASWPTTSRSRRGEEIGRQFEQFLAGPRRRPEGDG